MNSRKDIQRELELISSSLPFDVRMPVFDLPKAYFENFAADVLARIKGQTADNAAEELGALSPLLAGLSKKTSYAVPDTYFGNLVAAAAAQDEDPVPGWGQTRQMPYQVPAGYFEQLPQNLLQSVAPSGAKVIPMFARKWVQYAAAAVVMGALVLGGILYSDPKTVDPAAEPGTWVAKKLNNVSNQELEAFLLSTGSTSGEAAQQTASNQGDVRKMLRDVPNSELDAFLSQLPTGNEQIN